MKRKIIALTTAVVTAFSFGVTAAGCETCDHVYNWTVKTEATCVKEGSKEGLCGICGDVKTEVIPVNPDNHAYGEWEITKPDGDKQGTAVKKCTANASHTALTVNLPVLTEDGEGYESEIINYPTQLEEGEKKLTYKHEAGDISFTVPVPIIGIVTVEDAVTVGSSFAHLVRKSYGGTTTDTTKYAPSKFYYEFGENYTHVIDDGDYKEIWYTLDEGGKPFGVQKTGVKYNFENGVPTSQISGGGEPKIMETPADEAMQGFSFTFGYAGIMSRYYGAEGVLAGVYEAAKASANKDFKEEIIEKNGETVYKYSFGSVNLPNYYSDITVEFTLSVDYSVKNLVVHSYAYDNSYEEKWVYDEEAGRYKAVASAPSGIEYIEFNQISVSELSEEEKNNVPVSPYDKQKLSIKSFDLKRGNNVLPDGQPVSIGADQLVHYDIVNVENIGEGINSLAFDPINVLMRTDNGDEPLSALTNQIAYRDESGISVRFRTKGEVTLVLKADSGYEKVVVFNVSPKVPMFLNFEAQIMESDATEYKWLSDSVIPAYVGQELHFRSKLSPEEEEFADGSFTAEVTSTNKANATLTQVEGSDEMIFTASVAGRYIVEMTSKSSSSKTCYFTVNVENVPSGEELFSDTSYTGDLNYPRGKVTVTSMYRGGQGIITVKTADGSSEQLSFTFENNVLTTSHSSGAELGFTVTLNKDCRLVLSHTLKEFDDLVESIILIRSEAE